MNRDEIMTGEKVEEHEMSVRNIIWQVLLVLLPWLVFWLMDILYARLLALLFGPGKVPGFVSLSPFHILLIVGVVVAWKRNFPVWSYTWIGTLYFFVYRELFEIVTRFAPKIMADNADLIINGFYFVVNPLALAFLLALVTRRDWLLACFTAYPYTTIIQAWYTLDRTPVVVLLPSFILHGLFAFLFMVLQSRRLKFTSLLAGTLVIGGGFYLCRWDVLIGGLGGFLYVVGRIVLILVFPLLIHRIPLYRRLFRCEQLDPVVATAQDHKTI